MFREGIKAVFGIWQPKVHKLTGCTYRIMHDLVIARHLYTNTTSLPFKAIS